MSQPPPSPLEQVLRLCAQVAPQPWYYRVFAKERGIDPEQLVNILEMLSLEGLVQKVPGSPEGGPGVTLTELGQQVVNDPEALRKLSAGEPVSEGDVGSTVRQSLRQRARPLATQLIVAVNLIVFAVGAFSASQRPGLFGAYMNGFNIPAAQGQQLGELWHRLGSLSVADLVRGEWWRMMTTTFLHAGVIHVGMNMYGMWVVGAFVERTWGSWRLLVIYFLSAWGGSCLAMTYPVSFLTPTIGASGAICGVLATEGIWILLYGKYLPRRMARIGRTQMITSIVMIVFISLMPRVSWQGHLGGAIAGGAAALALHYQRFGASISRLTGVVALLLIPWASFSWMERTLAKNPMWLAGEKNLFKYEAVQPLKEVFYQTFRLIQEQAEPLIGGQHPSRRNPAKVEETLAALEQQQDAINRALRTMSSRKYSSREMDAAQAKASETLQACAELCDIAVSILRAGEKGKAADERKLAEQFAKVDELEHQWAELVKLAISDKAP